MEDFFRIEEMFTKLREKSNTEDNETQLMYMICINLLQKFKKSHNKNEVKINDLAASNSVGYLLGIVPIVKEAEQLNIEVNNDNIVNLDEGIKYYTRIRKKGAYSNTPQGIRYKKLALKKIFKADTTVKNIGITEYKFRDTLTTDYSDRMNCILEVLRNNGTKTNPAKVEKNGFIVFKNGNALDDSDIELFHYLIGELEEHGCETEIVFRKSDIVNNMGYTSLRGSKLDNLTSSLMNLNAQSIAIMDNREDKVGKKLRKNDFGKFKGTQLLRADIIGEGDEVLIKFTSPFSKYFREQKQFGRIMSREMINKYLYSNTRVLKIARELSRMIFISSQKNKKNVKSIEINFDTLIKNIGEVDRYTTAKNKRDYLLRLNKDIEKAISYIETNIKHEIIKPTPKTIKNGKIRIIKN